MPKEGWQRARRWAPEAILAVVAGAMFLGCLGSVDLWGKREQRASAEAIDTIDRGHWLVAEIQGRPRLEKPPLPRWTIATIMRLTSRRDEMIVRLPSAISALGMVAVVYLLGRRMAGRSVGLASGLVLASFLFFIGETRQAGNDGPLAFFTTLALYAAWRRLHGESMEGAENRETSLGSRRWAIAMYAALGLGFLSKGPVVLLVAALALVPYLIAAGRFRSGMRALIDWRGLLLFLVLALCWPVPVAVMMPDAVRVWYLEMGQKAGTAGIAHHQHRSVLAAEWPWMTLPWTAVATLAVFLPLRRPRSEYRPWVWLPWWWTVGNLAMFCLWTVAKPNYYLPCLPGAALLTGTEWVRLTREARLAGREGAGPRRFLQIHWAALFVAALVGPVVVFQVAREYATWAAVFGGILAAGVVGSVWAWRRGADGFALAPMVGALAVGVVIGYGFIAPTQNGERSHRQLAATLDRLLPSDVHTVMFYRELDEGLWFYLHDRSLKPVPNSQPTFNKGYDLLIQYQHDPTYLWDEAKRVKTEEKILLDWLHDPERQSEYVLLRSKVYHLFAPDLTGLAAPVYAEHDLKRNEVVLLHAPLRGPIAGGDRSRR